MDSMIANDSSGLLVFSVAAALRIIISTLGNSFKALSAMGYCISIRITQDSFLIAATQFFVFRIRSND
jgi:hypothetical protein